MADEAQRGETALRCRLVFHRFLSVADGEILRWSCSRGCPAGASKRYRSAGEASRSADASNRDELAELGRRAPRGLFPLRIARWWKRRRAGEA